MNYYEYLKSPEWAERRAYMLERAGNRCSLCNRNGSLNVHHRTYDRLGREFDADLMVLCRDCHASHHGKLASPPWWEGRTIEYEWGLYLVDVPKEFLPAYGGLGWYETEDGVRVEFESGTDQRLETTFGREQFYAWLTANELT